jgi:DNA-binding response OmpR family regulator
MVEADQQQLTEAAFRERLAQIRHDLKTPVGHIMGYSEMLEEDVEDNLPEVVNDLRHIRSSGERILELINDHLGSAKQCANDIDLDLTGHLLRQQLNHVGGYCEMVEEVAEENGRDELLPDLERIHSAAATLTTILENLQEGALTIEPADSDNAVRREDKSEAPETGSMPSHFGALGEGGELLVVDDDPANLDLLSRRLTRQGYEVTTAGGGQEALDLLDQQDFDLVILDMLMPGINGLQVLRQLKSDPERRAIPVMMISALDSTDRVVECIALGAEDYIFKPFNPILLKARVSAALEKSRLRENQARKLTVFISSPGDVIPERRVIKKLLEQLNREFSGQLVLIPILWEEDPLLASETFQSQIHPPSETDIYIGIFWSRLGSPLPKDITREDGSRYLSGSEYEFEDAMAGFRIAGKPDLLIYRKTAEISVPLTNKEEVYGRVEQKERLEQFVRNWFMTEDGESYTGAFHVFNEPEQLEDMILGHLRKLLEKYLPTGTAEISSV